MRPPIDVSSFWKDLDTWVSAYAEYIRIQVHLGGSLFYCLDDLTFRLGRHELGKLHSNWHHALRCLQDRVGKDMNSALSQENIDHAEEIVRAFKDYEKALHD